MSHKEDEKEPEVHNESINSSFNNETDNADESAAESKHKHKKIKTNKILKFSPKTLIANKKYVRIALIVVTIFGLLLLVPQTRYPLLGNFVKRDFSIEVVDSKTGAHITEATVEVNGIKIQTDNDGVAEFEDLKVGPAKATITKEFYTTVTLDTFVGLNPEQPEVELEVNGTPLKFSVVNKISKVAVANVSVKSGESETLTGDDGKAVLVVAPEAKEVELNLSGNGFNTTSSKLNVTDLKNEVTILEMTPSGRINFLSKASGTIDVVSTNLDGTDREVVLKGTGNEERSEVQLFASEDNKYLVLKAKRDTREDYNALYVINTTTGKMTVFDEGNANFEIHGWSGSSIIFTVYRQNIPTDKPDRIRLKSYDAIKNKLLTIDRSTKHELEPRPGIKAKPYYIASPSNTFIHSKLIVFNKTAEAWNAGTRCRDAKNGLYSIRADGSGKRTIEEIVVSKKQYQWFKLSKPGEYYYAAYVNKTNCTSRYYYGDVSYFNIDIDGNVQEIDENIFNKDTRYFKQSPDEKSTVWTERRDGKNYFFVGNEAMGNGKEIFKSAEHYLVSWHGNDYILTSKRGNELYIMSRSGGQPVKISDYHGDYYGH